MNPYNELIWIPVFKTWVELELTRVRQKQKLEKNLPKLGKTCLKATTWVGVKKTRVFK